MKKESQSEVPQHTPSPWEDSEDRLPHEHPLNAGVSRRHFMLGTASTYLTAHALLGFTASEARASVGIEGARGFWSGTFIALMDTIVPGSNSDPTGAPGAIEAGTSEFAEALNSSGVLPINLKMIEWVVSAALNTMAFFRYGRPFYKCDLSRRTRLVQILGRVSPVPLLYQFLRAPFYTGSINRVGFDYVGYPGANSGYADFSHGQVTWVPHPQTLEGNYP